MEDYIIEKISNDKYQYIILPTSFISPLDEVEKLEDNLKKIGCKGKIIIDLLLSNGIAYNRFIEAYFDGDRLDFDSIMIIESIDSSLKEHSINFYKKNPALVDNSILPKAQCYLIKKGIQV